MDGGGGRGGVGGEFDDERQPRHCLKGLCTTLELCGNRNRDESR
jgi:hypothetical protein